MPVLVCEKDFQNFWSRYKNAVNSWQTLPTQEKPWGQRPQ